VMEVDLPRQRIALSMRLDDEPGQARATRAGGADARAPDARGGRRDECPTKPAASKPPVAAPGNNALADAFARARKN
jgi:protein Tex